MLSASLLALLAPVFAYNSAVPPILDPSPYTTWVGVSSDGLSRKAVINVPFTNATGDLDNVYAYRIDLIGDNVARGFAHVSSNIKASSIFVDRSSLHPHASPFPDEAIV